MSRDFVVVVHGPRAEEWRRVFGSDRVCVKSPHTTRANVPGHMDVQVYMLDLAELDVGQRVNLVEYLSGKFGLTLDQARAEVGAFGVPILAEDCDLFVYNPQMQEGR